MVSSWRVCVKVGAGGVAGIAAAGTSRPEQPCQTRFLIAVGLPAPGSAHPRILESWEVTLGFLVL